MTMFVDNYALWKIHEREEEEWLAGRPECDGCGEAIQTDYYFEDEGDRFCERCWADHVRDYFLKYVEV